MREQICRTCLNGFIEDRMHARAESELGCHLQRRLWNGKMGRFGLKTGWREALVFGCGFITHSHCSTMTTVTKLSLSYGIMTLDGSI